MSAAADYDMRVAIEVPASVANLGPGFDALGMALDMRNRYVFHVSPDTPPEEPCISITGEGVGCLPCNAEHLAYRACAQVLASLGCAMPGLKITQHNTVPMAGGLGNSATAVVAGVLAANELAGRPLSPEALLELASQLEGHPDNVAPALLGGMTVCATGPDKVASVRIPLPEAMQVVLAVPNFTLNTTLARKVLPSHVPLADAAHNVGHAALLVAALCTGRCEHLAEAMRDRLHEPYRKHLVPGLEDVCRGACAAGALGAALAGAGPTIMALTLNPALADDIGEAMVAGFAAAGIASRFIVTRPSLVGATVQHLVAAACD